MMTNYFKVAAVGLHPVTMKPFTDTKPFFFDDRSPDQVRAAFDLATQESIRLGGCCKISVYRRPKIGGPWDSIQPVGHGVGALADEFTEPS